MVWRNLRIEVGDVRVKGYSLSRNCSLYSLLYYGTMMHTSRCKMPSYQALNCATWNLGNAHMEWLSIILTSIPYVGN